MLEVHAPHKVVHTWKDFFIHIATIAIGLLIAIGLEQAVEWNHHRNQLRDARAQLSVELEENRVIVQKNLEQVERDQAELDLDMRLLREHKLPQTSLATKLDYSWNGYRTVDVAWQAVRQNGSLDLMPYDELKANDYLYEILSAVMDSAVASHTAIEVAGAIAKRAADGNVSAQDAQELVTATSEAQGKLTFTAKLLRFEAHGLQQRALAYLQPESQAQ
jgi:hypothetical protein